MLRSLGFRPFALLFVCSRSEACTPEALPPTAPTTPTTPTTPGAAAAARSPSAGRGACSLRCRCERPRGARHSRDADESDDWLVDRDLSVTSYNLKLNAPQLGPWNLDERYLGHAPRSPGFHSDTGLPKAFYVVRDDDYVGSGYDRGHLCPSADRTHDDAMNKATFVFTNALSPVPRAQRGPWGEARNARARARERG